MTNNRVPAVISIMLKVFEHESGCWLWLGARNDSGYGGASITVKGVSKRVAIHRFLYEECYGAIPEGLELDHQCNNIDCVNPRHMMPMTHGENVRRGGVKNGNRCRRGHLYSKHGSIAKNGYRHCRACARQSCG